MLSTETVLSRAPDLTLQVDSSNGVRVSHHGEGFLVGPFALALLDVFHQQRSVADALGALRHRIVGEEGLKQALSTIAMLLNGGVLRRVSAESRPELGAKAYPAGGYDTPGVHIAILSDRQRKSRFLEGIREVVKPGDVVVDLGTGSGIMTVAAVKAGARHVYAIEPSSFGGLAQRVFDANGVSDRVTLIRGWGNQVVLPERGDVLLSDIVGNEPLDMQILEANADALQRLLKPDARLLPRRIRLNMALVEIPAEVLHRYTFGPEQIARWRDWYSVDFEPLLEVVRSQELPVYVRPDEARSWPLLSEPRTIVDLDLRNARADGLVAHGVLTAERRCTYNGVIGFFELELGATTRYSTRPDQAGDHCHWFTPLWVLTDPVSLPAGGAVRVTYRYDGFGRTRVRLENVHGD
jgi:predicted RNA methylase